jgi:hypothetical protein
VSSGAGIVGAVAAGRVSVGTGAGCGAGAGRVQAMKAIAAALPSAVRDPEFNRMGKPWLVER